MGASTSKTGCSGGFRGGKGGSAEPPYWQVTIHFHGYMQASTLLIASSTLSITLNRLEDTLDRLKYTLNCLKYTLDHLEYTLDRLK